MAALEDEIALAEKEIAQAREALKQAARERIAARGSGSETVSAFEAAVIAAKNALTDAEINLRRIYEAKDDGTAELRR
jgi:hypothetical protein